MDLTEMMRRMDEGSVLAPEPDELSAVLEAAEIVGEHRTSIAGAIRTLRLDGRTLVQERDQRGRHYVRALAGDEQAARFVKARLDAYERMWDG